MKEYIASLAIGVLALTGYGAGFTSSPQGLPSYISSVTTGNYGAGFAPSPNLVAGPGHTQFPNIYARQPIRYNYNPYQPFYPTYYGYDPYAYFYRLEFNSLETL